MTCAGKIEEKKPRQVDGKVEKKGPRRVNGTLKKVWKSMGTRGIDWVTLEKPPLEQKAAGSAAAPEAA